MVYKEPMSLFLRDDEKSKLKKKYLDINIQDVVKCLYGKESLSELCNGNFADAEIFLAAAGRAEHFDDLQGAIEEFVYNGNKDDEELRKKFSSRRVKEIRKHTSFSQERFAEKAGIKRRTLQNYEEGSRIPSRIIVDALKDAAVEHIDEIVSVRRLELDIAMLSEVSRVFLEISRRLVPHFALATPIVNHVEQSALSPEMYFVSVENDNTSFDLLGDSYRTDRYPADLAACVLCAIEFGCNELKFTCHKVKEPIADTKITRRIRSIMEELPECEDRKEVMKLIREYRDDMASGDPERRKKWFMFGIDTQELAKKLGKSEFDV
ncbi:MAG: helix-turn-helix transcriptional regulator [Butyrivibrio sp.]|nr:helix-turn-helix transcriptional regulator [Butyrivibrio sp.]